MTDLKSDLKTDFQPTLDREAPADVTTELKPEVSADLRTDVKMTLEELASTGRSLDERLARRVKINSPRRGNAKLHAILQRVNEDEDLYGLWLATNVNAMERLGMT